MFHGQPAFLGITRDITDRTRADEAVRKSEAQFRAIVENSHDGILFLDANRAIVYRSPSYERINGYSDAERLGQIAFVTVHPDDQAALHRAWTELLSRPDALQEICFRTRHKNGSWRWVETSLRNLLHNPQVQAVVATTRDVTERKQAEQALRESTQHYLTVAQCIPDAIFSMDLSGRLTYVSPNVERMFGWTGEEMLKLKLRNRTTPEQAAKTELIIKDELSKAASPQYNRNRIISFESEQLRKDGTTFWAEINAVLIWSDDGQPTGWTGVARDITERKRAEEEEDKLQKQLFQAQKLESIGQLAGGVAHDFNNLLQVINGYSDLLLHKLKNRDSLHRQVAEIRQAGNQGAALTRQLLAFSREQIIEPKRFDLDQLIDDNRAMLQRLVGEDIEIETIPASSPALVMADPGQLHQVLMNLAANSRDAMPRGGKFTIRTTNVDVGKAESANGRGLARGPFVLWQVSDTGTGIPQDVQERIFDPFFTTKEPGKGTGLGLATVYGIVRQSGGTIAVSSELGRGTTFHIYLPRVQGTVSQPDETDRLGEDLRGEETVLVVEDRPDVRNLVVEALQAGGYRVLQAREGSEALQVAEQHSGPIHLLLTDVIMPHMTGKEVAERLKQFRAETKVLYMSGYAADVVSSRGLLDSGEQYIAKPFCLNSLLKKVYEVLGRPQAH
jgi:PAS domain S-box-containing protein